MKHNYSDIDKRVKGLMTRAHFCVQECLERFDFAVFASDGFSFRSLFATRIRKTETSFVVEAAAVVSSRPDLWSIVPIKISLSIMSVSMVEGQAVDVATDESSSGSIVLMLTCFSTTR